MRRDPGILCCGLEVRRDETSDDMGDVVPRDADVFQLPVVKAVKRGCRLAAVPAFHRAGEDTRQSRAKTGSRA